MFKKRYLFLIIIICLLAISAVSAAEISNETNMVANDFNSSISESVNKAILSESLNENEIVGSADNGTFTALQKKINGASEGSIINLENDYEYNKITDTDGVTINKTLTINGNGHTIKGNNSIYISSSNVILNNITFYNTFVDGYNGKAHDITISNCIFCNNINDSSTSTLSLWGNNGLLINSTFINNKGNAASWRGDNVIIINSNFFNNSGCGLYRMGANGRVINSRFINNTGWRGGALYLDCKYHIIYNSTFINNIATESGGAIYSFRQGCQIHNSTFINNSADYVGGCLYMDGGLVNNSIFINNSGLGHGGAIYYESSGDIINSTFINNSAYFKDKHSGYGGAIYFYFYGTVNDSLFVNNSAYYSGGAIFCQKTDVLGDIFNISNSIFFNNSAQNVGAIDLNNKYINIINSTFNSNQGSQSGVICPSDSQLNIVNSSFINNKNGCIISGGNKNLISNSTFLNNSAEYGASILIYGSNTIIENSLFKYNNASIAGGAIQIVGTNNIIDNSCFLANIAPYGSAIQWYSENGLINNSLFINNKGTDTGTIHVISDNVTISKSILINNADPYDVYSTVYTTVANDNWFGNNLDNQTIMPKVSSEVIIDNWHYLDVNTDSNTIKIGTSAIVNIDLSQLSNNDGKIGYNNELPDICVNVTSLNGVCNVSTVKLKDGKTKIIFTPENVGYGSVTVNYLTISQTIDFIIKDNRIEPNMTFNVENKHVGETVEIKAFLPSDATGNVVVSINNKTYSAKINKGKAIVSINDLPAYNNDFIIDYAGDTKYSFDRVNGSVFISKISDYNITTSNLSIHVGDSANIVVNVPSDARGNISLYILSDVYKVPIVDGKATIEVPDLSAGMYGFYAFLMNDPKYELKEVYGTITVSKISDYSMSADDVEAYPRETTFVVVNLPTDATGKVTLIIGDLRGTNYTHDGTAKLEITNFSEGKYTFIASYEGDNKYSSNEVTGVIRVQKISNYAINTTDIYIENGETATIIANLPLDATGSAKVRIFNDEYDSTYTATVYNGQIIVNEDGLSKNSKFTVDYLGNYKYESKSVSGSIFVKKNIVINAPDLTKYYHDSKRFVVIVKEDNKPVIDKVVNINLNGVSYDRITDSNGQASMAINLNSGVYNVTTEYEGIKVNSTVTVKPTVSGNDVTKIFRNGTQYYATFVDSNGNLLKNTDVKFNINGVFYTRTTDANGRAKMNINLPPGTYVITAENPVSTEKYTNVITVLSSIVENYDLTKYYKNASQYSLRLLDDKGNPVGAGVSIQLNINGVFYTRTSDANGYVKMNINLPPGTYIITAEYKGLRASNTIKVLSVLETHNLVMKYKDGSKFEAKVLDGQGKPYAGQTVTFNINGVFYPKVTDDYGIARLTINLPAGEYIITSSYNGLNCANGITINYDFWHLPDSKDPNPEVGRINYGDGWVGQIYNDNYKRTINLNTLEVYGAYGDFTALGIVIVADDGRYYYYDNGDFAYHGENYDSFEYHTDAQWWYNNLPKSVNPRPPLAQYFDILGPNGANGYVYYPDGTYEHYVNDIVVDSNRYVDKSY